ncbi:hypothetical protein MTR67_026307, partial [Solanum verrucosum]
VAGLNLKSRVESRHNGSFCELGRARRTTRRFAEIPYIAFNFRLNVKFGSVTFGENPKRANPCSPNAIGDSPKGIPIADCSLFPDVLQIWASSHENSMNNEVKVTHPKMMILRMMKSAHFLLVKISFSADDYAKLYIEEIVKLHGVPLSIISDRGTQYTSHFWKAFQRGLGTNVKLSTVFHPETDGQAEQTIQILEDMLRVCVIDFKGIWEDHLPLIEFAYNNSYHSSIAMAPFEAIYGRRYRSPVGWFEVGEFGLIGPNLVYDAIEKVRLIRESKLAPVHPVFHVSILWKCIGDPVSILPLQGLGVDKNLSYEDVLVEILDWQVKKLRNKEAIVQPIIFRVVTDMKFRYPHIFPSTLTPT